MHHIAFHCFEEDLHRFKRHLKAEGLRLFDPPPGFDSNGLWFRDMDGLLVELRTSAKTTPDTKATVNLKPTPPGQRNAPYRRNAQCQLPRRLSHILMFTPDVDRASAFYTRILGLRVSDRSADVIAFLHGVHGCDHHLMAFVKLDWPSLHHLSWDVPSVPALGPARWRWPTGASAMAGASGATCWTPTISTTCRPGSASGASIRPTSTTSRPTWTGRRAATRWRMASASGGRHRRPISSPTPRRREAEQ
jgi:hypothetical protein